MTPALALAWAAVVVAAGVRRRPPPERVRGLGQSRRPGRAQRRPGHVEGRPGRPARRPGHVEGRPGRWAPRPGHCPPRAVAVAAAIGSGLVLAAIAPPLAVFVPALWWGRPWWRARVAARRRQAEVAGDLPEVVDLLRVAVGSGLTIPLAIDAVGRRAEGPVARALADAAASASRGGRLADALDALPEVLGESGRTLAATLAGSLRYGHAIGPALERLAAACRDDQRRQAEAAARRVPVLMLFPLVVCILPAFALLTVAPLVAGALRALRA